MTFVGSCIVIYFYSKTNHMHNISNLFYFGTTPYMFRTVFPYITSLRLYIHVYCTLTVVFLNLTEVFRTLSEVFPCFFLSCKANARVKLAKTGHGPHSSTLVVICVVRLLFVLSYVLFVCKRVLPPGDNPTAVNKYIISYHTASYHTGSVAAC